MESIDKEEIFSMRPIYKEELLDLFKLEEAMCKLLIPSDRNAIKKGTGFFCEIENDNFPIKYCLFTEHCVLNETDIKNNKTINCEFCIGDKYIKKKIIVGGGRKVYSNKELHYSCIEIFKSDGIKKYFKIDPILLNENNIIELKKHDIFILHYPRGEKLSFSYGQIIKIEDNYIIHNAPTECGSSGAPIIRRGKNNYILGLHYGTRKNKSKIANLFNSIFQDILKIKKYINDRVYTPKNDEKEDILMNDDDNLKSSYLPPLYLGLIFDVSKEDLKQLIRFDNQKNFLEDFISEIDGEIITLINGNEKVPYYDLNEILISSINYLGETNTIYSKNNEGADFYCNAGKKTNLFDEICLKKYLNH